MTPDELEWLHDLSDRELRLRAHLLDEVVQGVISLGTDRRITYWNPAAERLFRISAEEAVGRPIGDFLRSQQTVAQTEAIKQAVDAGESWTGDVEILREDGSAFWAFVEDTPLYDKNDTFVGMLVVTAEITKHVELRKSLEKTENRLNEAQRLAKIGSWELDIVKDELWWSEENYRIFGQPPDGFEATYQAFLQAIHPDDRDMVDKSYTKSLKTREPYSIEHRLLMPDGSIKWVQERCETSYDNDGNPLRSVGTTQDITNRLREEELRLEGVRLQGMAEFRSQFLNMAAHELNTPLTPLALEIHLIQSGKLGPLNDSQRRAVELLERSLKRLHLLVQDMLDAARLQAGSLKVVPTTIDVGQVVRDAFDVFQAPAEENEVTLQYDGASPVWAYADMQRMEQVMFNLVSNAIRYSPSGGAVTIQVDGTKEACRILVTDHGIGLDQNQIDRLFQPFTQVHDASKVRGGTGLGLYITRGIVEALGGQIGVTSEGPGTGSTFWFTVPRGEPP